MENEREVLALQHQLKAADKQGQAPRCGMTAQDSSAEKHGSQGASAKNRSPEDDSP